MIAPEDLDDYAEVIASIESKGRGDYGALGKVMPNGDRAYGKYQVMGTNVPSWTQAAIGKSMTPEEFAASPEAQEKVFRHRFGGAVMRYGNPEDAASEWFTGKPAAQGATRSDGRTTGAKYVQKFSQGVQLARAARGPGDVVDPGDEEILRSYSPKQPQGKPGSGEGPSDEEILKRYAPPPAVSAPKPAGEAATPVTAPATGLSPIERINQAFNPDAANEKEDPHDFALRGRYTEGPKGEPRWMPPSEGDQRFDYMMRHPEKPENLLNLLAASALFGGGPMALARAGATAGGLSLSALMKGAGFAEAVKHYPTLMHILEPMIH